MKSHSFTGWLDLINADQQVDDRCSSHSFAGWLDQSPRALCNQAGSSSHPFTGWLDRFFLPVLHWPRCSSHSFTGWLDPAAAEHSQTGCSSHLFTGWLDLLMVYLGRNASCSSHSFTGWLDPITGKAMIYLCFQAFSLRKFCHSGRFVITNHDAFYQFSISVHDVEVTFDFATSSGTLRSQHRFFTQFIQTVLYQSQITF